MSEELSFTRAARALLKKIENGLEDPSRYR